MNKKRHRLEGTLGSEQSMNNLKSDIENAKNRFSSGDEGFQVTQPLTPCYKKQLSVKNTKNRKMEYEITASDRVPTSNLSTMRYEKKYNNKKKSFQEYVKISATQQNNLTEKNKSVLKNQLSQVKIINIYMK